MSLVAPPPNSGELMRVRGFAILILLVLVLVGIGFGLAKLIALPFGGVGTIGGNPDWAADRGGCARRSRAHRAPAPGARQGRATRASMETQQAQARRISRR